MLPDPFSAENADEILKVSITIFDDLPYIKQEFLIKELNKKIIKYFCRNTTKAIEYLNTKQIKPTC